MGWWRRPLGREGKETVNPYALVEQRDGSLEEVVLASLAEARSTTSDRVDAARDAGVEQILVLYTDATLGRSEQIAVQLAHNAVVGADNKQVLRELWEEILEVEFKAYSGLDESLLETVDASALDRLPRVTVVSRDSAGARRSVGIEAFAVRHASGCQHRTKMVGVQIGERIRSHLLGNAPRASRPN